MREVIYSIIFHEDKKGWPGKVYDVIMLAAAMLSVVPLMFKTRHPMFDTIDTVSLYVLFLDYILRWIISDFRSKYSKITAFIIYPFTPLAVISLLCILPYLGLLSQGFRVLRLFMIIRMVHYSRTFDLLYRVFKREQKALISVLIIALGYIFVSALLMFTYEPDTFDTFFDALYWATSALTTIGYGDIYPVSDIGKLISMVSSIIGIAVIALPAGIVTAGFMEEIREGQDNKEGANDEQD